MHGPDLALAAVPTRHGPQCNYSRYSAFVLCLPPSSSPFNPRTPACYDAQTPLHHIHTGRRGTCSRMPTVISLTHSDLTHAVSLTLGRSLTRAVSLAHAASSTRGAPFTHGVLGSTHSGTLATTPLTHAVPSTHRVSSTHGGALTPFTAHTGTITLGILATSRAPGASIPPKLRVHPFAALAPSTPPGTTEPTWS